MLGFFQVFAGCYLFAIATIRTEGNSCGVNCVDMLFIGGTVACACFVDGVAFGQQNIQPVAEFLRFFRRAGGLHQTFGFVGKHDDIGNRRFVRTSEFVNFFVDHCF